MYMYMYVYISADPSAVPEGEAQGKREASTSCQLAPGPAPHLGPARACFVVFCPAIALSMLSVQPCIASRAPSWQPCFDPWPTKTSLRSGACTSIRPISLLDVNHHCTSAGPNQSHWL